MAEDGPSKADIAAVFKKLRAIAANKACFDCQAKNPTWSSVTYGVFICIDCSAVHRGLGVHLSFVRSTQLDTNWTWLQLRAIQCGGNAQAVHLDTSAQLSPPAGETEVDFFQQHSSPDSGTSTPASLTHNVSAASLREDAYITGHKPKRDTNEGGSREPFVAAVINGSTADSAHKHEVKKSTIGGAKKLGASKKSGMGAKKFGAEKMAGATFEEIEQKAEMFDKEKEEAAKFKFDVEERQKKPKSQEQHLANEMSARLMVQDMSDKRKKEEQKLKSVDPNKSEQFERLGMGFGQNKGTSKGSHSIAASVQAIQQEGVRAKTTPRTMKSEEFSFEDASDSMSGWTIVESKGGQSSTTKMSLFDEDDEVEGEIGVMRGSGAAKEEDDFFSQWAESTAKDNNNKRTTGSSALRRGGQERTTKADKEEDALKKFQNAKAISSEQFFGKDNASDEAEKSKSFSASADVYETRTNLARFEGASGLGSADLFADGQTRQSSGSTAAGGSGGGVYASHVPEMADIREGVRQGVSRVAGRLGQLGSYLNEYSS